MDMVKKLVANVDRIARMCAESYAVDVNPVPALKKAFPGAEVKFGYYQGYDHSKRSVNWNYIGCGVFVGISYNKDGNGGVTVDIFDGEVNIAWASAAPETFGIVLAEVNDYSQYIPEKSTNGGAYLKRYEFRYDGCETFSGITIGDVFKCTSCEMVPQRFVGSTTFSEFLEKYAPKGDWGDLVVNGYEVISARYHRADEG